MRAGVTGHCSSEPHISLHKVETFIRGIIHSFVHHPCHTTQISNIKFSLGLGRTISERCEHNVQCSVVSSIIYLQIWGRRGEWGRGAASPCSCRRTWRTTSWCPHCSLPSHLALTLATLWRGFTTCYLSTVYCSARLLISWISPFVIADWNKRQDYIMVRWQGKKICAIKLLMNLDSNAHYYIVSTQYLLITIPSKPVPLHVVRCVTCHVSRVTALSSGSRLSEVTVVAGRGHWRGQTRRVRTMRCTLHAVSHINNIQYLS